MTPNLSKMQTLACNLARRAGDLALQQIDHARPSQKHDRSVVTTTDHEIQSMIVGAIEAAYPDHAICGEETPPLPDARVAPAGVRYCWVVDPLDGTRNYVAKLPCFATSIALLDLGEPVVGVVYEHNTRSLFSAMKGCGASLNGAPIRASELGENVDHLLGAASSKDEMAVRVAAEWQARRGFICRNLGSTAYEMGLIASGAMSGMLGRRVKIWDIAAGALLIREAGGVCTDPQGGSLLPFSMDADPQRSIPFLAASAAMHGVLLESIRQTMSDVRT